MDSWYSTRTDANGRYLLDNVNGTGTDGHYKIEIVPSVARKGGRRSVASHRNSYGDVARQTYAETLSFRYGARGFVQHGTERLPVLLG